MKKLTATLIVVLLVVKAFASGHTVTITKTDAHCNGGCDGTATANVSGGVGPFQYVWTPGGITTQASTGLCAGAYTVTVTDGNDMSTATATVTITSSSVPVVTNSPLTQTICSGSTFSLNPTSNIAGTTYIWTASCTSGSITGFSTSGLASISNTLNNNAISPGTVTYVITPTGPAPYSCPGVPVNYVVSVNPNPTITNSLTQTICSGSTFSLTPTSNIPGTTYSWTASASSGSITGFSASGSGSISETIYNSGVISGTVTYLITPTGPAPSYCQGTPVSFVVTVNPLPISNAGADVTFCSGSTAIIGTATNLGYSYQWFPATGLASTVVSNPAVSLFNASTAPITTIYTVTTANTSNGCVSTDSVSVTVNANATVNAGASQTICPGVCVTLAGMVGGSATSGTWVGGSGTFSPNNTTLNAIYCPSPTESGTVVLTLVSDDPPGPCPLSSSTVGINIIPKPYANFTMVPDSTNGLNYYAYNTTTGSGLVYNWDFGDGGSSTLQSPSHLYSSTGTYTVTLTVTNANGCVSAASHTITVNATPATCLSLFNIAFDTTSTDPYAYTVYNLSYGSNLTYSWLFGDGTSSTLQNPTHVYSGGGPYQLCLVVNNGSGCVQTYCDSLMYVDSLSRSNNLSIHVVDGTPSVATGIQEQTFNTSVNVSPNPFSDNTLFVIQSNKSNEKYSFELMDVLGKKVKVVNGITSKQFEISRDGLQNGIYFYKIYSAESVVGIGKLVIK